MCPSFKVLCSNVRNKTLSLDYRIYIKVFILPLPYDFPSFFFFFLGSDIFIISLDPAFIYLLIFVKLYPALLCIFRGKEPMLGQLFILLSHIFVYNVITISSFIPF